MIAQAYKSVGLPIVKDADCCTPKDIEECSIMTKYEDFLIPASEEIIMYANSASILKDQDLITGDLLCQIRGVLHADIQTFEQLWAYLLNDSSKDEDVAFEIKKCKNDFR